MSEKVVILTADNWEREVMAAPGPVLVDFWADWCGPCRHLGPVIEELAGHYAGKVKIGKLDVDANAEIALRYGVQSIPTLLFFRSGQPVDRWLGARPAAELRRVLDAQLEQATTA